MKKGNSDLKSKSEIGIIQNVEMFFNLILKIIRNVFAI